MAPSLLDDDLVLGDCDSDDEVDCPASSSGRTTARRLMQARAQQCIVCMEEKEHTFVPPHQTTTCQVEGHRFCSDCWIDFLDHGLLVLRRGVSPAPLSCPICRSCIHVPDVWTVDVELPTVWQGTKKEVDSQVQCKEVQVLSPTSDSERSAEQSWVSAESTGSDDCAPERHMLPPLVSPRLGRRSALRNPVPPHGPGRCAQRGQWFCTFGRYPQCLIHGAK